MDHIGEAEILFRLIIKSGKHAKELCISPNIPLVERSLTVSCLKTLAHVPQAHNQKASMTSPSHQQATGTSLKLSKFS